MLDTQLKSQIQKLWDKFWSGGISNPLKAIEQISFLIFMKRLEDEDVRKEQEARLTGERFKSIFDKCKECRWSEWSNYSSDKIMDHVRDKVFPFLRNLDNGDSFYAKYMKNANFEIPTASLLMEAVRIINDMHIKEQNQDAQGDMYEFLLSELQTAGKNGQFRTPRHIIKMMIDIAKPEYGDRILDPACGTAGFLVNSYEYILNTNKKEDVSTLSAQKKKILDEESLYGYDIDQTMTRISLMNLMMHGLTKPNIQQLNTLSKRYNEENTYDLILANPPFKGSIDESEMSDNLIIKTKKTELLFLELMYNSLASGGRCAVIVPDGVLFGNSKAHKAIRQLLLEKCRLDAIIKMPSGVFKPYAGVSTAVLFFTKGEPTQKVWFYDMQSDGFSLDDKRTKIGDGMGDIPEIVKQFEKRKEEPNENRKKQHFFVPIEEIKKNDWDLSISKYKEIEYEEVTYEPPQKIVEKIETLENEILKDLKDLKGKI
jgi:type I restriction enzyme M protein